VSRDRAGAPRWAVVVALAVVLPLTAAVAAGRTLVWRDTARLFEPLRASVVEALRDFRLPLWNPHEALGLPLFAQLMHGVLHPVSLVGALVAPTLSMDAFILVHLVLAALGAWALARQLGASPPSAAVAGLAFGLSGYVLAMSGILQYLAAAGTAPMAVAALRRDGAGPPTRLARLLSTLAVAASLLAGDPQWTAVAIALGLALAAEAGGVRGAGRAARSTAIGLALAGVQLVPTVAHLAQARRAVGLSGLEREMWALAPWRLLELTAPGFFGGWPGEASRVFQRLGGPSEYPAPFVQSVFVGAVPLALAVCGLRATRAGRVLGAAALLLLWAALGTALGADQLLRHVPVWGAFRYAEKLVGPLTLCLAVLSALGVDALAAARGRRDDAPPETPGWTAWRLAGAAALAAGLAALLAAATLLILGGRTAADAEVLERLGVGLVHPGLGLGALGGALLWWERRPGLAARFPAFAAGLVWAQGMAAAPYAVHLGFRDVVEHHPLAALRAAGAENSPEPRIVVATQGLVEKQARPWDQADWLTAAQSRMGEPSFNAASHLDQIMTYTGLEPRRHAALSSALRREFGPAALAAWRRFGLTHVVVNEASAYEPEQREQAALATQGGSPALLDEAWGFTVFGVPHRPWAFFAERVEVAPSEEAARHRLVELLASEGDRSVVVEAAEPLDAASRLAGSDPLAGRLAASTSRGRILGWSRGEDRLRLEAESDGDGLLVVNDAFWPGWQATLDGRAVQILAVDALVRGVPWPAGRHVLEMRYDPPELRAGWLLSAAGLALLLALAIAP
jgi:hypothetical protein